MDIYYITSTIKKNEINIKQKIEVNIYFGKIILYKYFFLIKFFYKYERQY